MQTNLHSPPFDFCSFFLFFAWSSTILSIHFPLIGAISSDFILFRQSFFMIFFFVSTLEITCACADFVAAACEQSAHLHKFKFICTSFGNGKSNANPYANAIASIVLHVLTSCEGLVDPKENKNRGEISSIGGAATGCPDDKMRILSRAREPIAAPPLAATNRRRLCEFNASLSL